MLLEVVGGWCTMRFTLALITISLTTMIGLARKYSNSDDQGIVDRISFAIRRAQPKDQPPIPSQPLQCSSPPPLALLLLQGPPAAVEQCCSQYAVHAALQLSAAAHSSSQPSRPKAACQLSPGGRWPRCATASSSFCGPPHTHHTCTSQQLQ